MLGCSPSETEIVIYGITAVWKDLTVSQLRHLNRSKMFFCKRIFGLGPTASNRITTLLSDVPTVREDLVRSGRVEPTDAFRELVEEMEVGFSELDPEVFLSPAMTQTDWRGPMREKRHVVTRFAAHGFHFKLCFWKESHTVQHNCVCRFCFSPLSLLHGIECPAFQSLSDIAIINRQ